MRRTRHLICFLCCLAFFCACQQVETNKQDKPVVSTDKRPKKVQSEEKLQIVQSLMEKLQKKKVSLDQTGTIFEQEIVSNVQEIRVERSKQPPYQGKPELDGSRNEFESAMNNKRIENCLKAIQKASAYKDVINSEAEKTEASVIELQGTTKQLRLDITVLGALEEEKADEILAQLDLVINHIQPQAEDLVISPDTPKKPLEDIFEKYIREPEQQEKKEKERSLLEQQKREEAVRLEQQKREELARLEQLKKIEEARLEQQRIAAQAKVNYELEIQRKKEADAAEQKRILEEKQRQAQLEKDRLDRVARELAEKKRQEEIARVEAEEERKREERELQEEKRQRLAAEQAIAHVKIIQPAIESFHTWDLTVNWSNSESLLSLLQQGEITLKEIRQNSTGTIKSEDIGEHQGDLYFIDLAFSESNSKLAILTGPSRLGSDGNGAATVYLWSISGQNVEKSIVLPSSCQGSISICGDSFEVLGWKGNHVVVSGKREFMLFTDSIEARPIYIINASSGSVNSSFNGYSSVWKDSSTILVGSNSATKQIDLSSGATTSSYNECDANGSSSLYYNFCPSPLKILGLCYATNTGTMTTLTAAGDNDIRSSAWNTAQKTKKTWEKLSSTDSSWCIVNGNDPEVKFTIDSNTEFPLLYEKTETGRGALFVKDAESNKTLAMLIVGSHTFSDFKTYFSPRGNYVLLTEGSYASAWDISSL